jgi:hypothetical protein
MYLLRVRVNEKSTRNFFALGKGDNKDLDQCWLHSECGHWGFVFGLETELRLVEKSFDEIKVCGDFCNSWIGSFDDDILSRNFVSRKSFRHLVVEWD